MNKAEFEYLKEQRQQQLNTLDIEILDNKIAAKQHNVETSRIQVDIARAGVDNATLSLEQSLVTNDISREKLQQSQDNLEYERSITGVQRELLMTQGQQIMLKLDAAQTELQESQRLHELKYNGIKGLGGF